VAVDRPDRVIDVDERHCAWLAWVAAAGGQPASRMVSPANSQALTASS
jgi:hypothetical protein